MVHLSEDSEGLLASLSDISFLGPFIEDEIIQGIAQGQLCPNSYKAFSEIISQPTVAVNKENVKPVPSSKSASTTLHRPTILKGNKVAAQSVQTTVAVDVKEDQKPAVEFWERISLKRSKQQLDTLPSKKVKDLVEVVIDTSRQTTVKSPYFSASQDSSTTVTIIDSDISNDAIVRRSPRISRQIPFTAPTTMLKSPLSTTTQASFYAKENLKNTMILTTKIATSTSTKKTLKKFSSQGSPGLSSISGGGVMDENVKNYIHTFAAKTDAIRKTANK